MASLVYGEREQFGITTFSDKAEVVLALQDKVVYKMKGRNILTTGHPFLGFKFYPGSIPDPGE